MKTFHTLLATSLICFILASCNRAPVIHDLSGQSFSLVNQDSASVNFPKDFEGKIVVMGFIYTHCPDICPIITAKLGKINRDLGNPQDVHFVDLSFDPQRDTPSVLKRYMENFNLPKKQFTMLTGQPSVIDSLLAKVDISAKKTYPKDSQGKTKQYFMQHTNRILVMDQNGEVRFEYPGSFALEKYIIEDLQKLR